MTSTSFVGYKEEEINFGGTIVVVVVAIDLRQRNFSEGKKGHLCVRERRAGDSYETRNKDRGRSKVVKNCVGKGRRRRSELAIRPVCRRRRKTKGVLRAREVKGWKSIMAYFDREEGERGGGGRDGGGGSFVRRPDCQISRDQEREEDCTRKKE